MRAKRQVTRVNAVLVVFLVFSGCGGGDDDDDVDAAPPARFRVGGVVDGLEGQLVLQNNGGDDLTVTSDGAFTFSTALEDGAAYAVTIADVQPAQECGLVNGSGTIGGADVVDVSITCQVDAAIERVSVDSAGAEALSAEAEGSFGPDLSGDGRYVAFVSVAYDLVEGDTNGVQDIFVHDRQTDQTTRVSVASDGTESNAPSYRPSISDDGRYVAFQSRATNLIANDTNAVRDVFLHDRQTGQTICVSTDSDGVVGDDDSIEPAISGDGRYVAFTSAASNLVADGIGGSSQVYVFDREAGEVALVSVGLEGARASSYSQEPAISADGRYVSFSSRATNLVAGDTNGVLDIFVRDVVAGETVRVSLATGGAQGSNDSAFSSISAGGLLIAFISHANDLVAGDTNAVADLFVHNRTTGETTRVNVDSSGAESAEGLVEEPAAISGDGRYVAFPTWDAAMVSGDENGEVDVLLHDLQTGETRRVSVAADGSEAHGYSWAPALSFDGGLVAFSSDADDLVAGDTNGIEDVFVAPTR